MQTQKANGKESQAQTSEDQATAPQLEAHKIYLKDFSLEVPTPMTEIGQNWQPQLNLEINADSKALAEASTYEVVLKLKVTVTSNSKTAFVIEVDQAGIFGLNGMEEEQSKHTLGVFCPNLLYPYLREVVAEHVVKAGFPQLNLAPINFDALYAENQNKKDD